MVPFLFLLLLMPASLMWSGYVLSCLWGWFIVPTFGLPPLAVAPAIGVALVVSFMAHQRQLGDDDTPATTRAANAIAYAIAAPAVSLLVGWLVNRWAM